MALFIVERVGTGFSVRSGENTLQAAASALTAEGWADAAALSAATAEAAAGPTYASTAAGLAATTSGEAFAVDAGGGLVSVYLNSSGTAVLQRTLATTGALAASGGSALVGFLQSGTGVTARTVQAKLRDVVSVKDFGATGADFAEAIAAHQQVEFPTGAYSNTTTAITFPFGKTVKFQSGAVLSNSGSGSATYAGVAIREGYNASSLTGWTDTTSAYSYEGLSVELGGYGPRQFGSYGTPTALNGSTNVPATATIANHANGVSGYIKNASTTTGGVAIYGEANRTAASALIWGLNTRTQDGGFGGLNVWGYEMDMNIDNATTTAIGFDAVGGSTVEPTNSIAYLVQPIGIFASPKKRWQYGFRTTDMAAVVGVEIGAVGETANSASQTFQMLFRNAANAQTIGLIAAISSAGDASITGGVASSTLFALKTPGSTVNNIALLGDALGLYGATPVNRATTAGAAATFTANAGTAVNDASTFDGYTLGQVVKALRNVGLLT